MGAVDKAAERQGDERRQDRIGGWNAPLPAWLRHHVVSAPYNRELIDARRPAEERTPWRERGVVNENSHAGFSSKPNVGVKEAVLPFARFPGVDTVLPQPGGSLEHRIDTSVDRTAWLSILYSNFRMQNENSSL